MRRLLRIDMSAGQYRYEEMTGAYANLGGRGLTSLIVSREVPATIDSLAKENKLVVAAGLLAGTNAPNNGRLSVGTKSPLTNTIKEANSGGAAAQKLAHLGIQGVVVEGAAPGLTMVKIDKEGVQFIDADGFKGMGNYDLIDRLKERYGEGAAFVTIGPAGEAKMKTASIAVTSPDFRIRMASRGGVGAVMGSKNLKALIIDDSGTGEVEVADKQKLKEAAGEFTKLLLTHPLMEGLKQLGTPLLVMMINGAGCLPTKNFSVGQFEGAEKISGEYMVDLLSKRPNGQNTHRCMNGCVISCSNVYTDDQGKEIVSGLEYETLGLMGSNCGISDLDDIARLNRLCNDLGLDTMEIGAAIGVAMEGGLLAWGDGKAAFALVEEAGRGEANGTLIASGCVATGNKLGVNRIPAVKGQSLAAYDPRVLKGTGCTYATCPMGADHTAGNALPSPAHPEYNPTASTGQGPMSQFLQAYLATIDTLGMCLFASLPPLDIPDLIPHLIRCAVAVTGEPFDENYMIRVGASVVSAEKRFNEAAGFTPKEDRLPEFFRKEPLPPSGLVFDVPEAEIDAVLAF